MTALPGTCMPISPRWGRRRWRETRRGSRKRPAASPVAWCADSPPLAIHLSDLRPRRARDGGRLLTRHGPRLVHETRRRLHAGQVVPATHDERTAEGAIAGWLP